MVLFCHVTSRVESDPHQDLLRQKGGSGFPYLVFLDADGQVIAKQGQRTVDAFRDTLEGPVGAWFGLVDLAATGDPDAQAQLFARKVEFGHFDDVEAARDAMAGVERLSDEERARLEQLLVDQEFNRILGTVKSLEEAAAGGERALGMLKKDRIPASGSLPLYYWVFLGQYAAREKDTALLERSIAALEEMPRAAQMVDQLKKALEELRKG